MYARNVDIDDRTGLSTHFESTNGGRASLAGILLALALALLGPAAGAADAPINLPCEPSRACAFEMARAAAEESERLDKGNLGLIFGLLGMVELQAGSADRAGYARTVADIHRYLETDAEDRLGARASLAGSQANAGLFDDALITARGARAGFNHDMSYRYISEQQARRGLWREAMSSGMEAYGGNETYTKQAVMQGLLQTGRRDWVMEALPTLAPTPERQAQALSELERISGNLAVALEQALRVTDLEQRWLLLSGIATTGIEKRQWSEVVAVANVAAEEGPKARYWETTVHRLDHAIAWLCAAGRFDEALDLVPKVPPDWQPEMRARIAGRLVSAHQYARARELLKTLSPDLKSEVSAQIAMTRALAGDTRFDKALEPIGTPVERLAALRALGEQIPDSRRKEVRDALRAAVKAAVQPGIENPDFELVAVGELQAKRGFIRDAQTTAARIDKRNTEYRVGNLCALQGAVIRAQAASGDRAAARRSFELFEPMLREPTVNGYIHAQFVADLNAAGLLPEAFAQVQALVRRAHGDKWYTSHLEAIIRMHVEASELRRAFEIAVLASNHDRGNAWYFLEIARTLPP